MTSPWPSPDEVRVERPQEPRPRRLRHQRRAPAGQGGRPCRRARSPSCVAARLRGRRRHRGGRRRRPGLPQHHRRRRRRRASSPRTIVAAGAAYGAHRRRAPGRRSTSSSSRPTRPARCTSAAPAGPRSATRSARLLRGRRRRGHPGVLLQRPRRPDRPVRPVAAGRAPRASRRPRTATPAQYIADIADAGAWPSSPRRPRPARRRGAGGLPGRRRRADVRRDQADAARLRRATSTSTSTRTTCTSPAPSTRAIERLRELGNIYETDGAVWLRTDEFGDDKDRVIVKSDGDGRLHLRRRGLLPRQAGARLRPVPDHARRRPPRLRRPADGACARPSATSPGEQPRDPHRPDGQPAQRRPAGADGQARRQHRSRWTTWSRRSASTPPATRWPATRIDTNHRHRPRPVDQARPTTTRSSTCSTPTPASASILRNAGASSGSRTRGRLRPRAADPRDGGRRCCARSASSRGWSRRPPSCASRTGWRATSRTLAGAYHRFYDELPGAARWATRSRPTCTAARLLAGRRDPDRAGQRPRPARASPPRSGCECRAHEAGWRCTPRARARPVLAAPARTTSTRWSAAVVADVDAQATTAR